MRALLAVALLVTLATARPVDIQTHLTVDTPILTEHFVLVSSSENELITKMMLSRADD